LGHTERHLLAYMVLKAGGAHGRGLMTKRAATIPVRNRRPETYCTICGPCPEADREAMRLLIDEIPQNEPVCDDCLLAFWEQLFAGEPAKRVHH
jgi:hypothetical protein